MNNFQALRLFTLSLILLSSQSCGKKSSESSASLIDLSQYETIQFKASSSTFGVGGSRYDLNLSDRIVTKYSISSDTGGYVKVGEATFTAAMRNDFSNRLQKTNYKAFGTCSDCNMSRPSVWVEITETSRPLYYFSNEGDCSCPSDDENAPTLEYGAMKKLYDDLIALF